MHTVPSKKNSAYKLRVALMGKRGWYRVQSGTNSSVYDETSANSHPARKPCTHMRFIRALTVVFFVRKEPVRTRAGTTATPLRATSVLY